MSDIIQLLPDSVANQIAAGEVIQRPASVIKELVENSIDAGATHIQVLVCDAGKASIQVIDDGCGMSDTDARLSFERHATSKIREAVDLFSLHTMGFRGEALASIAAVAQVTLQTRTKDEDVGTRLRIDGSQLVEQEVVSCPVGSNFLIENLFFNIPARRKFLKSNATEMNNITQAFERIVLVYPEINFSLYSNGQEVLSLRTANFHQRIIDVFGKRLNQQLLPVQTDTSVCKVDGFVGKPESAKKKGYHQYFFVNGRYMKHPYFHKAVMSAYDRLVPNGEQVSYFLNFTVNPEDIDVNIHPVKTEIKFENEQVIWQILMAAVRDAVGRFTDVTSLDFDVEGKPDIPVYQPDSFKSVSAPRIDYDVSYNPFKQESPKPKASAKGWEELFGSKAKSTEDIVSQEIEMMPMQTDLLFDEPTVSSEPAGLQIYWQENEPMQMHHMGRFVMVSAANGVATIDHHRASVRVLYEQYMRILEHRSETNAKCAVHTQRVLFPEVVQFPPSYASQLDEILDELRTLGFEISNLGARSYSVDGMPADLVGMDPVQLVNDLVAETFEQGKDAKTQIHSILALALAERAAVPYGEVLNADAMKSLVMQLLECESQRYTPDGKKILTFVSNDELERQFR